MRGDQLDLRGLEGLRFIASAGIVVQHYTPYVTGKGVFDGRLTLLVDLFFVISGIVIAHGYAGRINSGGDYLAFMQKRVARLYPLHFATLAFYVAIGWLAHQGLLQVVDLSKYDFSELVPNLLLTHAWLPDGRTSFNYVSWSISAEFFVYLAFPLIAWLLAKGRSEGFLYVAVALVASIAVFEVLLGFPWSTATANMGILRALPSFALGVWLSLYRDDVRRVLGAYRSGVSAAGIVAAIALLMALEADRLVILALIYGLVAVIFAADLSGRDTFASWRALSSRGYLTYSIYMLHPVVATVVISYLAPRFIGTSGAAKLLAVVAGAAITYALAVLSYRLFENPMRRALSPARPHWR